MTTHPGVASPELVHQTVASPPFNWPLPLARGPLSSTLLGHLTGIEPSTPAVLADLATRTLDGVGGRALLDHDDLQLTLAVIGELSFRGIEGVDDAMEDDEAVAAVRRPLERALEAALRTLVDEPTGPLTPTAVSERLWELSAPSPTPGFAHRMATEATLEQHRELMVHRSLYQLREADPHTFGIARLPAVPKRTLLAVQWDEYGSNDVAMMHSELFARAMRAAGLSDRIGHYIDHTPAITLALLNVLSMFALHRRHLGALMGTLCALETTSTLPMKRYRSGLRRLGLSARDVAFHTEHVEVDAVHEQLMVRQFVAEYLAVEPHRAGDVLFGAATYLAVEDLLSAHMSAAWDAGRTSLRQPLPAS